MLVFFANSGRGMRMYKNRDARKFARYRKVQPARYSKTIPVVKSGMNKKNVPDAGGEKLPET